MFVTRGRAFMLVIVAFFACLISTQARVLSSRGTSPAQLWQFHEEHVPPREHASSRLNASAPDQRYHALVRRAVEIPTMDDFRQRAIDPRPIRGFQGRLKTFIFWTLLNAPPADSIDLAQQWCACNPDLISPAGCLSLHDVWYEQVRGRWYNNVKGKLRADRVNFEFMPGAASQAYAELAAGDVFIFARSDLPLDAGAVVKEDIVWFGWEYPSLMREGSGVDRVFRVDPRPGQDQQPILSWDRQQAGGRDPAWTREARGGRFNRQKRKT